MFIIDETTEKEIRKHIKKRVREILLEMAYSRNEYIDKVSAIFPQIITHWCLIRYFSLIQETKNKLHWQGELLGFFKTTSRYVLKNSNQISRERALFQMINANNFKVKEIVKRIIEPKFIQENVNSNNNVFYDYTIEDYLKEVDKLTLLIANQNYDEIVEYIKKL